MDWQGARMLAQAARLSSTTMRAMRWASSTSAKTQ
jgi:hypothetical protein